MPPIPCVLTAELQGTDCIRPWRGKETTGMILVKGFRFGMLLQLAIGPVCLFIFQTATISGFETAATGVLGVLLVDGLYILAAILGIASLVEKKGTTVALRIFGSVILFVFGFSTLLGVFGYSFIPGLNLAHNVDSSNVFLRAVLLTSSNPLTIIFWAGVFSAKLAAGDVIRKDVYAFGAGALLATLFFLMLTASFGSFTGQFLPPVVIQILNVLVGAVLIYFGAKMLITGSKKNH